MRSQESGNVCAEVVSAGLTEKWSSCTAVHDHGVRFKWTMLVQFLFDGFVSSSRAMPDRELTNLRIEVLEYTTDNTPHPTLYAREET